MQIRAGNRQDEDKIRTIIFNAMKECGLEPEPEGREDDLMQILESGASRARSVAEKTMEDVYRVMGLLH